VAGPCESDKELHLPVSGCGPVAGPCESDKELHLSTLSTTAPFSLNYMHPLFLLSHLSILTYLFYYLTLLVSNSV
jgi:hypothetical protein